MNIMLDIETLGRTGIAAIVAIGAVVFDPNTHRLEHEFYCVISEDEALKYGISDEEAMAWWLAQPEATRQIFSQSHGAVAFIPALELFAQWLQRMLKIHDGPVKIWSNGAGFDCLILRNGYTAAGLPCPWNFWNEFDVRTLVELGRQKLGADPKKDMPFEGPGHNALNDARHQAQYVSTIWQLLGPTGNTDSLKPC
ncbi:3'-5' exonuclease [Serratia marcescens]|uniref:3'-5' exonuclease n=1 Tax=Serratia marcescens TaxID=615 RepID=UPI00124AA36B|nr:3'-5' exonuclease [Serratia marcescens]KAB1579669.1 3'-5' exoribonuclease [Serratia marcescens]